MRYSMEKLIQEARVAGRARGHNLKPAVLQYSPGISGEVSAVVVCRDCGMKVTVTDKPMPNQIEIGGELVALNCTASDLKGWSPLKPQKDGFYLMVLLDEDTLFPDVPQVVDIKINPATGYTKASGTLDGDIDVSTIDYALWHGPLTLPEVPSLASVEKLFSCRRAVQP